MNKNQAIDTVLNKMSDLFVSKIYKKLKDEKYYWFVYSSLTSPEDFELDICDENEQTSNLDDEVLFCEECGCIIESSYMANECCECGRTICSSQCCHILKNDDIICTDCLINKEDEVKEFSDEITKNRL